MAQQADMQNLINDWMQGQQKLWQDWVQSVQQAAGGAAGSGPPWTQGLSRWQEAVEKTLETQKQATRAWAEQVAKMEGAPDEMKRWASEGVNLVDQWTDAQHKLWQQWFDLMGKSSPAAGMPGEEHVKQLMSGWEQMAGQMQALQRQWASALSGMQPGGQGGGGKPRGGAKK